MTEIYSNHPQNYAQFDSMQGAINALADIHDQHNKLYATLDGIIIGETATAMQQLKVQHSQKLDQQQADLQAHQQWGVSKVQQLAETDARLSQSW